MDWSGCYHKYALLLHTQVWKEFLTLHYGTGFEREKQREREREREMVPTYACMAHVSWIPRKRNIKKISAILVFDILLQVDLLPIEVAALSPLCCMSTEPR